jgi:ATP-binding protein involved in chromosome partitioning
VGRPDGAEWTADSVKCVTSALADALRERLARVLDPELGASIVELGMVGEITVTSDGDATVEVALTTAGCPLRGQIERDVAEAALVVDGVRHVEVLVGAMAATEKAALLRKARRLAQERSVATSVPTTTPVIALTSGKGGVGKSSITANLATALAGTGRTVGVLDADIWGFSVPRLLGVSGDVEARGGKMIPLERPVGPGRLKVLSMGFLTEEDQALLWRGLIVQRAVQQFVEDADWSDVDYLVIDTPPGTGDIAMALARILPQTGHLIVTTPAIAAQRVAARAADFARKSNVRVLGVIENMSGFTCECGERHALFGEGGGLALAEELRVPLVASLPLRREVSAGGDLGEPAALSDPATCALYEGLAHDIVTSIAPPAGMAGCSARLLSAVEEAISRAE